jgi:hypothetical protein
MYKNAELNEQIKDAVRMTKFCNAKKLAVEAFDNKIVVVKQHMQLPEK